MAVQARNIWQDGEPAFVRVWHPSDAQAYVEISRSLAKRLSLDAETLYFDGSSGQLLHQARLKPAAATFSLLAGLHVAHFQQPLLRALYFLAGVSGCIMLASGLLYWTEKRRSDPLHDRSEVRLVTALSASLIGGLPLATLAMLVANQLLAQTLANRASWEIGIFFAVWLGAALHATAKIYRSATRRAPWREQSAVIALLALAALLLNAWNASNH